MTRISLLIIVLGLETVGCSPFTNNDTLGTNVIPKEQVIARLDTARLKDHIGLDPSKLYVITGTASSTILYEGQKGEKKLYMISVDSVDGIPLASPLKYYALSLPNGMVESRPTELFANIVLEVGGRVRPTSFANKIPIPPYSPPIAMPDFSVDIYLNLIALVDRDPFKGGPPPRGEGWTLPDDYIQRLVEKELELEKNSN